VKCDDNGGRRGRTIVDGASAEGDVGLFLVCRRFTLVSMAADSDDDAVDDLRANERDAAQADLRRL